MWRRVPHSSQKGSNTTPQSTGQASRSPGKPSLQLPGVEQQWPAADESVISVRRDYAAGTTRTPLEAVLCELKESEEASKVQIFRGTVIPERAEHCIHRAALHQRSAGRSAAVLHKYSHNRSA